MFANVKRERESKSEQERERLVQARQIKHCIGGSTSRERERDVRVLFLNFVTFFFFFTLGTRLRISKFSIFAKKSDGTRCLAVSILEYNLGPKITGSEVQY